MTFDWDKVSGATATRDANGWHITRTAIVTGVLAPYGGEMAQPSILSNVNCPKVGDPYPTQALGIGVLPVASVNVAPVDEDAKTYRLTVVYELSQDSGTEPPGPGEPPRVEIGATLQSAQTGFAIKPTDPLTEPSSIVVPPVNEPIFVEYNAPAFKIPTGGGNPVQEGNEWTKPQAARVGFQVPQMTVRLNRREPDTPGWLATKYVGKVNGNHLVNMQPPWLEDVSQKNYRMWLCTRITGVSVGSGNEFDVTYEYQFSVDWNPRTSNEAEPVKFVSGWDPVVAYVDGKGDIPLDIRDAVNEEASPKDPTTGVNKAIKRVQVYPPIFFDESEIPLSLATT